MKPLKRFLTDETGPTSVEYAVMLALILVGVIGAVRAVGSSNGGLWGNIQSEVGSI